MIVPGVSLLATWMAVELAQRETAMVSILADDAPEMGAGERRVLVAGERVIALGIGPSARYEPAQKGSDTHGSADRGQVPGNIGERPRRVEPRLDRDLRTAPVRASAS